MHITTSTCMRFASAILIMTWACVIHSSSSAAANKKTFMVRMKFQPQLPAAYNTHSEWYTALLHSITKKPSLLYTYDSAYHGFSASLSPTEAASLRRSPSVLSVHEDTLLSPHTTRTPHFLGLKRLDLWDNATDHTLDKLYRASHDVVIGVIDTGVYPESPSFHDDDMPDHLPAKWGGKCDSGEAKTNFCNNKLIGVRFFNKGYIAATAGSNESSPSSARDDEGHGTHTASTAAGSLVANASLLGYARGNARGVANGSRLSVYRVCWTQGCFGSDIVAAIDRATRDGVHVLSISLGGGPGADYFTDPVAVAAFGATERGIFVSCSAGNSGPFEGSVVNVAPWITTVGAGTLDRGFPAFAALGNGRNYTGASLYSGPGMGGSKPVGLVYGGEDSSSGLCVEGSLDPSVVAGKVVLCDRGVFGRVAKGVVVREAGGVGMIIANTEDNGEEFVADSHLLPAVAVGKTSGDIIRKYAKFSKRPTALLTFGGTAVRVQPSPVVAAFSSRGPNPVTPQIFKPDVIAPGVNILAAWSGDVGPTGLPEDGRRTDFNIISGTSMSCPHVSGLAALMRAAHPRWSPAAVRSALVTTAYAVDNTRSPLRDAYTNNFSTPWAHGAGHVNLHRALTPGLVYDATTEDYVGFLCSIGYTVDMVKSVVRRSNVNCDEKMSEPGQLNYPSFSVVFGKSTTVVNYTRELTNVDDDEAGSDYRVSVKAPPGVEVSVSPTELVFKGVGDKRRYTAAFVSSSKGDVAPGTYSFGRVVWKSEKKQVKSPVSFLWN